MKFKRYRCIKSLESGRRAHSISTRVPLFHSFRSVRISLVDRKLHEYHSSDREKTMGKREEAGGVFNLSYMPSQDENYLPSYDDLHGSTEGHKPELENSVLDDGMRDIRTMTPKQIKMEKLRIWKNIITISVSFIFLFTAFNSMGNVQSSINSDGGLGTASLSTIYAALVVSCMFVPTWLIKTLKCKWTLVVCQLCYSTYILAQFWPMFETLIPAAIILGIGAAPMWSAKCTYVTQVGNRYAALCGETSAEPSITRFFGVFFMFFQTSQIWGNLISSLIFSTGGEEESFPEERLNQCGANYCNLIAGEGNSTAQKPSTDQIYLLAGILLGFALLASLIIAVLVDPLQRFGELQRTGSSKGLTGWKLLLATFKQMKNPYQILIIPLTLWSGFEQAFLTADFTAAFIRCAWGLKNIGFVLICYGATDAVGSILAGVIVKKTGRAPLFIFAACTNLALIITMLIWRPTPDHPEAFFLIASFWGLADAVWQTQINSFYGFIFASNEEAAFSNYRLWESIGFIIAYAYSTFICVNAKLYVLLGVLIAGMCGYLIIEFSLYRHAKKDAPKTHELSTQKL